MKSLADLSQDDVERILGIVDRLSDIELCLEVDGMKLHVRKFSGSSSATASAVPAAAQVPLAPRPTTIAHRVHTAPDSAATEAPVQPSSPTAAEAGLLEVRAPMLGRFFRASSPSDPPYVELGCKVQPGDTVCIIEVMKLFNSVKAGVRGTVVEILFDDGAMVEHDDVLFRLRPE